MNFKIFKSFIFVATLYFLFCVIQSQSSWQSQSPTCSSRILSLIPKTLKFHNQINGTKQLSCKASKLPEFVRLDEKCYLIISPQGPGEHMIEVEMTILQKNSNIAPTIIVPYTLSITKIRYSTTTGHELQYDISLNRIITIEPLTQTSWLVKPGQSFYTQFKVSQQMTKLFDKVFFEFLGLPQGLVGNQLTGEIKGKINVPSGYYPFAVRVYDFQGNSQTIETTFMVNNQYDYFIPEQYQQEIQLKEELARVQAQLKENSLIVSDIKSKIEKKLQLLSVIRRQLQDLTVQQRKLENTQKSLAYAMNWTRTNLEVNKKKFQSAQQTYNDFNNQVNDLKRAYQTSVFAIQQKQSQIEKQQLQADRKFDLYLQADKEYAKVRIQLDQCERNSQKVSNQVMNNLKQLQRANFVQNLVDIIKNN